MSNQNQHTGPSADLVRRRLTLMILNLRSWISTLPNSTPTVDRLKGADGDKRAARIVEFISKELGLEVETSLADAANRIRRSVAGVFGPKE